MTTAYALYVDPNSNGQSALRTDLRTMDWLVDAIKQKQQPKAGYTALFNILLTPDKQTVTEDKLDLTKITAAYTPKVDFIARRFRVYNLDFDLVKKGIHRAMDNLNSNLSHYLLYHEKDTQRRNKTISTYLVLLPTDKALSEKEFKTAVHTYLDQNLLENTGFDVIIDRKTIFNEGLTQIPLDRANEYMIGNPKEDDQYINANMFSDEQKSQKSKGKKNNSNGIKLNPQRVEQAVTSFIKKPTTTDMMNNSNERYQFLCSLAVAMSGSKQSYPDDFDKTLLQRLSSPEHPLAELLKQYSKAKTVMADQPELVSSLDTLENYLTIYQTIPNDGRTINMASNLRALLSSQLKNQQDNNDVELSDAANLIAGIYTPYLLNTPGGTDRDRLVIFDPVKGYWTHDDDTFYSLLTVVRPYSSMHDFETMMHTFAAMARNNNRIIKPYNKSQHLLFLDGVLDTYNNKWYELHSDYVEKLHMTERCQINIPFKEVFEQHILQKQPFPAPVMKGMLQAGGDWTPEMFINAYGNNEPTKIQYFLFGLSLGLFSGHNFGVHFDIQGSSGWGKSTLAEIYAGLFNNRIMRIPFQNLNGQFAFTSYKSNNSLIWIDECNIGSDPLNDEFGTPVYDNLANNQARFQVKNNGDYILADPPQVFVDGTQLLPSKEINTGPGRRTLVYELPAPSSDQPASEIEKLHKQAFAISIPELLHNTRVLQWLVFQMIHAYKTLLPLKDDQRNQLKDLKISLAGDNSFADLLPAFARKWRKDMANSQNDLNEWFQDNFQPFLMTRKEIGNNTKNYTLMHDTLAYQLYHDNYQTVHVTDDPQSRYCISKKTFEPQFDGLLDTYGWRKVEAGGKDGRKQIGSKSNINFKWTDYAAAFRMPKDLVDDSKLKFPFHQKTRHWYYLVQRSDA